MRTDRTTAEADRLDALWDRVVDGDLHASAPSDQLPAADRHLETFVLYLESLKPNVTSTETRALRSPSSSRQIGEARMRSIPDPIATVTPGGHHPRARSRVMSIGRTVDRIAAILLIFLVVAGLVLSGAMSGRFGGGEPNPLAALFGNDEADDEGRVDVGISSLFSINVRPGNFAGSSVRLGLWEVVLPERSVMSTTSDSGDFDGSQIGFVVERGSVEFGGGSTWHPVEEGNSVGDLRSDYVRNPDSEPAHLLILGPIGSSGTFPLSIGPWHSTNAASPADSIAGPELQPALISSVTLDDDEAVQYSVFASEAVIPPGTGIGGGVSFGPMAAQLHSVTVREGQLSVYSDGALSDPQPEQVVPGDTYQLDADRARPKNLQVTGRDNAIVLGLLTMPVADNHTLDQTVESIAPFWGEWTVPESGESTIGIRRLVLSQGAGYSLPTDAGLMYHVASGTVLVASQETGASMPVSAGGTFAQVPGTVLKFSNTDDRATELIQVVIASDPNDLIFAREATEGVTMETLVHETARTLPGSAILSLEVNEYIGENDGALSGEGGPGTVLISSAKGEIAVRRDGGDAYVATGPGEPSTKPALDEEVRIGPGGYLLAEPGAGWHVTGASGAPSTALVFSISPDVPDGATPVATPTIAGSSITIMGNAEDCDTVPLTAAEIDLAIATPAGSVPLADRSLRERTDGTTDQDTTEAIVSRMQQYADCTATGDYTLISAFSSDEAIRESESIQDLVRSGHDVEADRPAQVTLEDIQLFPDGRAGARAVIDGEAAYLTFVTEDGAWMIDVWDDSEGGRVPLATPAS